MQKGLTSFKDLVAGDRLFRIPVYQRSYSWTDEQCRDLWEDLINLERGKKHFFGTIILRDPKEAKRCGQLKSFDVFDLIDGQQRIITVLILLREILAQLKETAGPEEAEDLSKLTDLEKTYLKYDGIYKLELLGDDREFFENFVVDGKIFPPEISTPSRQRLKDASQFFRDRLLDERKRRAGGFRQFCIDLKDKIEALEMITYPVDKVTDAVLIFETVNDRGKPLSNLEKTKSFLMHMIYLSSPVSSPDDPDKEVNEDLRKVNDRFGNVYRYQEQISSSVWDLGLDEDSIQRYHFVAFEPSAKGERKYAADYLDFIKRACRERYYSNRTEALSYVRKYSEDLEKGFHSIKEIARYDADDDIRRSLERLFLLKRVANFYPLFIATWPRLRERSAELLRVLRTMEAYVVRVYVVGNRRADTGIHGLYSLAFQAHNDELALDELVRELVDLAREYANDQAFARNLGAEDFYEQLESRDIRYILYEYEAHLSQQAGEPLELNLSQILSEDYTVEHIWAQNPDPLPDDQKEEHRAFSNRLGNLTLASRRWNASWGSKPFPEKKEGYRTSSLRVQRTLADSGASEWRKANIEQRGRELVSFCLQRWKLPPD